MTFYVVWEGRAPGIYRSWKECESQVKGFRGARFKSFQDEDLALASYGAGRALDAIDAYASPGPIPMSYAVGASAPDLVGDFEYRGVVTSAGREIFRIGPLPAGTREIGDFLAVCHALALCARRGLEVPVYTDSQMALTWIRRRRCGAELARTAANQTMDLVERAERWLSANHWRSPVLQWNKAWGKTPAIF